MIQKGWREDNQRLHANLVDRFTKDLGIKPDERLATAIDEQD